MLEKTANSVFVEGINMPSPIDVKIEGDKIKLQREQWNGNVAYISNYPGLLDEVKKYTWTYTAGKHPYLKCSASNVLLHQFVLQFLYGKEKLEEMIGKSNIIEHLDNNGLNCTYENLHVLSEDMNKSKAFSIDKKNAELEAGEMVMIPALITDVYYSHKDKYFQLQVFFNKNIVFHKATNKFVQGFIFHYNDFDSLFIDWLYCFECIKREEFDVYKHHAVRVYSKDFPKIELKGDEKPGAIVERDGKYYLIIGTDPENGPVAFMNHIPFERVEDSKE